MKDRASRNAGIIAGVLAVVLILLIYALVGNVDLVFKKDGHEVYRIENATVLSDLTIPEDNSVYYYTTEGDEIQFEDSFSFRFEIVKVVFVNFFNHEWQEHDNYIELNAR